MTARARTLANRFNARRSTGPRSSVGLARSAQNAVKAGLFSKLLALPALGESANDLDQFRAQVVASLAAVGAAEREVADRIAGLMWRLRRVARHEVAAMTADLPSTLPPRPEDVGPAAEARWRPFPPDAPAADRLADVRHDLESAAVCHALARAAVGALEPITDRGAAVDEVAAEEILRAALVPLGWQPDPDPWPAALAAAGFKKKQVHRVRWTPARLERLLNAAADAAGRDRNEVLAVVRARLVERATAAEQRIESRRHEEAKLVATLNAERETAVAAKLYADEALIQRVARAEGHLSRELDRALALLARVQGARHREPGNGPGPIGFVLSNGVSGSGSAGSLGTTPTLERVRLSESSNTPQPNED